MRITLMSYIPYDLVFRKCAAKMHCDRQLYNTEIGCKVPTGTADMLHKKASDLFGKFRILHSFYILYIIRFFYQI